MAKTKEEIISLMTEKFQEHNRDLCRQFGMSEDEISQRVDQAEQTIMFLLTSVYEVLESENIIAK